MPPVRRVWSTTEPAWRCRVGTSWARGTVPQPSGATDGSRQRDGILDGLDSVRPGRRTSTAICPLPELSHQERRTRPTLLPGFVRTGASSMSRWAAPASSECSATVTGRPCGYAQTWTPFRSARRPAGRTTARRLPPRAGWGRDGERDGSQKRADDAAAPARADDQQPGAGRPVVDKRRERPAASTRHASAGEPSKTSSELIMMHLASLGGSRLRRRGRLKG